MLGTSGADDDSDAVGEEGDIGRDAGVEFLTGEEVAAVEGGGEDAD